MVCCADFLFRTEFIKNEPFLQKTGTFLFLQKSAQLCSCFFVNNAASGLLRAARILVEFARTLAGQLLEYLEEILGVLISDRLRYLVVAKVRLAQELFGLLDPHTVQKIRKAAALILPEQLGNIAGRQMHMGSRLAEFQLRIRIVLQNILLGVTDGAAAAMLPLATEL